MSGAELHMISNGRLPLDIFARIAGAIHPFVSAFHLREKLKTAREVWEGLNLLTAAGVPLDKLMINDRIDVAWSTGARGVQLAYHSLDVHIVKRSFPGLQVGCSVHSLEEAVEKESKGADFLIFGHVFSTGSKPGIQPKGLDILEQVIDRVRIPVIAIGGIKPAHITQIIDMGAAGIAVMSGILDAEDPLSAVKEYYEALHREEIDHAQKV